VVDPGDAERAGRPDVGLDVVDEHARLARLADQAERVVEDARLRLAHADLAGDDDRVEDLVPSVALVGVGPGVGEQAGLDAVAAHLARHAEQPRAAYET